MTKSNTTYKLIGFYENFNNSGKLKLKLANADNIICCYIEDINLISKYLSKMDNHYISQLAQCKS